MTRVPEPDISLIAGMDYLDEQKKRFQLLDDKLVVRLAQQTRGTLAVVAKKHAHAAIVIETAYVSRLSEITQTKTLETWAKGQSWLDITIASLMPGHRRTSQTALEELRTAFTQRDQKFLKDYREIVEALLVVMTERCASDKSCDIHVCGELIAKHHDDCRKWEDMLTGMKQRDLNEHTTALSESCARATRDIGDAKIHELRKAAMNAVKSA